MKTPTSPSHERRSFLSRFHLGAASLAALALGGRAAAQTRTGARWEPARHDQDNWMDELPGKHRLLFDTVTAEGLSEALLFANNFMIVNRTEYGLSNSDLAVIIVVRHRSTAFAFNDAMWAKYGAQMGPMAGVAAATSNPRNAGGFTMDALARQGVQFAVCAMATMGLASSIAEAAGESTEKINRELTSNLIANARMVPAGIVAVNRAQERGYSLVTA
jgi:intracellular sulfur oxidation DsrE/DsrF family protein